MSVTQCHLFALALSASLAAGCGAKECSSPSECPFGTHCQTRVSGSAVVGTCESDCYQASDCPAPTSEGLRAICDNEGRCQTVTRVPKLRISAPEPDQTYTSTTRTLAVSGAALAGEAVEISVQALGSVGCPGAPPVSISLENDENQLISLPFSVDPVLLEPTTTSIEVSARVRATEISRSVPIQIECPDCPSVAIGAPQVDASVASLILPTLRGTVSPPVSVVSWRVYGVLGGVFDGTAAVGSDGAFEVEGLPLFGGNNRVQVVVSGAAPVRCSTRVQSAGSDRGLRAVLVWDTDGSDLDFPLVGPEGQLGVPGGDLSPRSPVASFGGEVLDDFDGFGPELLSADALPDGIYGLVVEPVTGAGTARTWVLDDGVPLGGGPLGPRYLDAAAGELWVVGTLRVSSGAITLEAIDATVDVVMPPTRPPSDWPSFY